MNYYLCQQEDGSFLLRFDTKSLRSDVALTRSDLVRLNQTIASALNTTRESSTGEGRS